MALTVLQSTIKHTAEGYILKGIAAFTTTSITGEIPTLGMKKIKSVKWGAIGGDEGLFLDEVADAYGIVTPVSGQVTVGRSDINPTSALQFSFEFSGY